jgi:hypothetical protein
MCIYHFSERAPGVVSRWSVMRLWLHADGASCRVHGTCVVVPRWIEHPSPLCVQNDVVGAAAFCWAGAHVYRYMRAAGLQKDGCPSCRVMHVERRACRLGTDDELCFWHASM